MNTGKHETITINLKFAGTEGPIPLDRLSPKIATLYRYWEARHQSNGLPPRRGDIDAIEIARTSPELLPHIWMVDVLRSPYRFRHRLTGSGVLDAGSPFRVGDIIGPPVGAEPHASLYGNLVKVCEERTWTYRCGPPTLPHSRHVQIVERISLPLVDANGEVSIILCASLYSWQEGWGAESRGT